MRETKEKITVLFLCTGNACRSQMAEGWAKHLKSDLINAYSAGVMPAYVSSRATEVMAEAGVDISDHYSKHINSLGGIDFDYVITLCDNAKEQCPVLPGNTVHIHKPFKDPSFLTGKQEHVMNAFRKVRDQIRAFVNKMPQNLENYIQQ
ncbi:MAG: arsenate reductase ArsC [Planctomycetota bacterium]|jgi:arsenate reductase